MAVPLQQGQMKALPSAQLCRECMMQQFGATLLEHLGCDWSLSFSPVLDCVQTVFRGRWCSFEHVLEKQKVPIGSSGCTSTGAKSKFKADRNGALLGYSSREASSKVYLWT
ncbi:hypothetical protein NDU88_004469 [Pleurodeles waltl]|uniref:Uncharacterized protein n=1 Tax=Pleurodeles waltl TaxID=8319 RepID=A0AAV7LJY2_PLEWA|nr:hypothetical protein NDU88_004469 [Pleurodeles waltl]